MMQNHTETHSRSLDYFFILKMFRGETEPHARGSNREDGGRGTKEGPDMVSGKELIG